MDGHDDWLAERFESHRSHLRSVAYRMLGSSSDADDAVQEAWLRVSRADTSDVENMGGWLTTVVARVCLNMLRSRRSRREESLGLQAPEPFASGEDESHPEHEALLADSVGPALLVVLDKLAPAERLALVLHDMFAVPFDEIAPIVERTPTAAKKLASRARHRVRVRPSPLLLLPISVETGRLSTPSSLPHVLVTWTRFSPCSIRTSCTGPTEPPCQRVPQRRSAVRKPWRSKRWPTRNGHDSRICCSWTEPRESSWPHRDGCCWPSASRSRPTGSPRST